LPTPGARQGGRRKGSTNEEIKKKRDRDCEMGSERGEWWYLAREKKASSTLTFDFALVSINGIPNS